MPIRSTSYNNQPVVTCTAAYGIIDCDVRAQLSLSLYDEYPLRLLTKSLSAYWSCTYCFIRTMVVDECTGPDSSGVDSSLMRLPIIIEESTKLWLATRLARKDGLVWSVLCAQFIEIGLETSIEATMKYAEGHRGNTIQRNTNSRSRKGSMTSMPPPVSVSEVALVTG